MDTVSNQLEHEDTFVELTEEPDSELVLAYKKGVTTVVGRVVKEGHGVFFSHVEIDAMLELYEPSDTSAYKKYAFKRLFLLDRMKDVLLVNHNMHLTNVHGKGYVVMIPDDQVKNGSDPYLKKALKSLEQAKKVQIHVDTTQLSEGATQERARNLSKIGFIQTSFADSNIVHTL